MPTVPPSNQPESSTVPSPRLLIIQNGQPLTLVKPTIKPSLGPPPRFAEMYRPEPKATQAKPKQSETTLRNIPSISGMKGLLRSAKGPIEMALIRVPIPGFCLIGIQSNSTKALINVAEIAKLQPV